MLSDGQFTVDKRWFWDSDFGFLMVYTAVFNASYEIISSLLFCEMIFYFYVAFIYFGTIFCALLDVNEGDGVGWVWGGAVLRRSF